MNEQRVEIVFANPLQIQQVPPATGSAWLTVKYDRFTVTSKGGFVMYTLPVDHTVQMQVSYVDANGNPATIDGDVTWASSDDTLCTVAADADDDTICTVTPAGPIGQVQITATCDADLGSGVRELITTADISLVGGEAVAGSIQPIGEPEQA